MRREHEERHRLSDPCQPGSDFRQFRKVNMGAGSGLAGNDCSADPGILEEPIASYRLLLWTYYQGHLFCL